MKQYQKYNVEAVKYGRVCANSEVRSIHILAKQVASVIFFSFLPNIFCKIPFIFSKAIFQGQHCTMRGPWRGKKHIIKMSRSNADVIKNRPFFFYMKGKNRREDFVFVPATRPLSVLHLHHSPPHLPSPAPGTDSCTSFNEPGVDATLQHGRHRWGCWALWRPPPATAALSGPLAPSLRGSYEASLAKRLQGG